MKGKKRIANGRARLFSDTIKRLLRRAAARGVSIAFIVDELERNCVSENT